MKRLLVIAAIALLAWPAVGAAAESLRLEHVVVSHTGISKDYAQAIGRTAEAARAVAVEKFGFDMPQTITVNVTADPKGSVRLFNDGQDRFFLTVRSENDLRKPSTTGIFHLYGLCHEVGHLAMYRLIRDHKWMTSAAAEGWAHYLGSRIVDEVHAREGPDLWPDRYDYLNDGTKRLERQLAGAEPRSVVQGAGLWKELVEIVGDKGVAPIFTAWGKATFDPTDPGKEAGKLLAQEVANPRASDWWKRAEESLIFKRPKSAFAARTAVASELAGQPRELAHDDGRQTGKRSIAGGGHAVRFQVPGESWYLTGVRIHGSRYGYPAPPREDFHVWLCDERFQQVAEFGYPYSKFKRGQPNWVTLRLKPTAVPREFIVCVGFSPTATKGVFLSHDQGGTGNSLLGLPGGRSSEFSDGDWMIRVTVDQLKTASAPKPEGDEVFLFGAPSRQWTDATGKYQVDAVYLGSENGNVRLKKLDGTVITVPLEKLSDADQQFVREASSEQGSP